MTDAKVYLVDASVYIFRAWFSIPDSMTDANGQCVNAVYGYARFLGDLIERVNPSHLVVAFDESLTTSYRNEIYPEYKANRESPPQELVWQFTHCRRLTSALGVTQYASARYEADDIIGTLTDAAHAAQRSVSIVTRDKDLAQLIRDGDEFWDFAGDQRFGYADIPDRFGVAAERIADMLALAGDSVDNIPGVPGVGAKTAVALLQKFGSLDEIYDRLDDVAEVAIRGAKKLGQRLADHESLARLSRQLTEIVRDVPVPLDLDSMKRQSPDLNQVKKIYDELNVGQALRLQAARLAPG